ncbi:UMP kinase [Monocercomonoides exilis]|uniref:UMP kinase n=1 Tax=Monocercomonoides exilis TaxID=2049356 RepID=UPI00355AC5D1|nr:UMP kinase [Monocercomonoides exilis]|eukprot:MONOS_548.1-p1 / transcript=MONOS_548.1 / gene=MONOS_548 / organism=Monocercomonoides_exilis_PA203 / gene_product=UMP kinase [EC:2.7.4.22] / transcript_product=UMP kinase [EC:2.7.4.22] / location=Mono_scaffold00008:281048-281823(+) / protein_length=232 / sequence_SO=supercontig / SO=protein_coding / is_pseudo=false
MNKTFVLSVGGSLVATPGPQVEFVKKVAEMLIRLKEKGILCHVVIGGGRPARDYIAAKRACAEGLNPDLTNAECDECGILATRMNAHLLLAALGKHARQSIPTDTTPDAVSPGLITVMGGTIPGQSTDAVSVKLARAIQCKNVINATNVPGVYEKDPRKNPGLPMLEKISHDQLIGIVGTTFTPGMCTVIDPIAAQILKEDAITCYVLDGSNLDNMEKCILGEGFHGTTIA